MGRAAGSVARLRGSICLDPHDLAAVKLQAGRHKDLALCAALLATGKLEATTIRERLTATRMSERMMVLTSERLQQIATNIRE